MGASLLKGGGIVTEGGCGVPCVPPWDLRRCTHSRSLQSRGAISLCVNGENPAPPPRSSRAPYVTPTPSPPVVVGAHPLESARENPCVLWDAALCTRAAPRPSIPMFYSRERTRGPPPTTCFSSGIPVRRPSCFLNPLCSVSTGHDMSPSFLPLNLCVPSTASTSASTL